MIFGFQNMIIRGIFGWKDLTHRALNYLGFLRIVRHHNLDCTRPRYIILNTNSPHSEVVNTMHTHLHILNIQYLNNLSRSSYLSLAFQMTENDLSKSSSTQYS